MTATARVTFGLAERGDLPSWFARVHPRFLTPHTSIAFFAAASATLALIGSYVWLAVISALARLFVYGVTIAALPRIPGRTRALNYAMAAAGIALCVWAAAQATADAWRTLGLLAVAGAILFFAARAASRSRSG
jgi:amino acid transporter